MDFSRLSGLADRMQHSTLAVLLWDGVVDVVMIEQSILGPSIRVMERLPRDESVFEAVADRVETVGRVPSRVTVCLPRSETVMRTMRYPAIVQDDLEQMVSFEASRHLPFSETERRLGYASVPAGDEKNLDVHLLATDRKNVDRVLDAMQAFDLPVDEVLVFSSLIAAGIGTVPSLLIISDSDHIEPTLICNGLVCDSRCLLRDEKLSLDTAVQRMLAANSERLGPAGIARLMLAGPVPLDEKMRESLCVTTGVQAENLFIPEEVLPALNECEAEPLTEGLWSVSTVLPLTLNLTAATRRSVPVSRRAKWMMGLAALLVIELTAGWILWTNAPSRAQAGIEKELSALRRRAEPAQKMKAQNRTMRRELTQLHDLVNTRVSVMELLKTLSDTLPEDTYLTALSYERNGRMQIKGRSKEPDKLPALLLLDVPFISSIEASDIDEKRGEYHTFAMTVALKGVGDE